MRTVTRAQAHITATYNNTIVTITDMDGNALAWSSSGHMGFKGPKKSTPYAAGIVVRDCMERLKNAGIREMQVYVRGVGSGREAAIRALNAQGVTVSLIKDVTPVPHNGPRPKKPRRV
ncbi:MAG: 30S ribosomal protein S11 [Candidatus Kerfeldbacteria bacterium]|nr:30S ribosomal protein S11 [Candidatus Kerfeldbacteria bacterium]